MRFLGIVGILAALSFMAGCDQKTTKERDPNAKIKIEQETVGTGSTFEEGDVAFVLYRGTLIPDNAPADSKPIQFDSNMDDITNQMPLMIGGVIEGFRQGTLGMKVGGTRTVHIPWELGYGDAGNPPKIPPYQDLTFEIKLLYVFKEKEKEVFDIESDTPGTGAAAKPGDIVEIKYKGSYLTGNVFDDSTKRPQPIRFKLGDKEAVIPGINAAMGGIPDSGVQPMKVGGKRTVVLPPTLMFGAGGNQYIQGMQPGRFEIELVAVNP